MTDHIVQEIERQGYFLGQNILNSKELVYINTFFDLHSGEFRPALVGANKNRKREESIRGDFTYWLDAQTAPDEFKTLFNFLNSLKNNFNQKLFLGIKDFETHLARYPVGSNYQKHLDRFETDSSRVISFVFYMNSDWIKSDGGELILYNKSQKQLLTVEPLPGSFVCFLSEEFPHEVMPARKERRSMTGWMHTKILN